MRALLFVAALALAAPALAATDPVKGIWALNAKHCADREGPNSRTYIDFENKENGKIEPLFDQYENHCRIRRIDRSGDTIRLDLSCHEFWELYEKRKEARAAKATLKLLGPDRLAIDGKPHIRCKD